MTNEQKQVADWMKAFGQEVKEKPEIPSLEIRRLRAKLILEETMEVIEALGFLPIFKDKETGEQWTFDPVFDKIELTSFLSLQEDLTEILDGCEDLKVVVEGTIAACGLLCNVEGVYGKGEDPHFNEVMRSNWTKLWSYDDLKGWGSLLLPWSRGLTLQITKEELSYSATMVLGSSDDIKNGKWLVKNKDGKVIKPPSYSPPSFTI